MSTEQPAPSNFQFPDNITEREWKCILNFKKKADEMLASGLLSMAEQNISLRIEFVQNKGVSLVIKLPPEDLLRSFLMTFRFFHLNDEPSNFLRIANILKRRADNVRLNEYVDDLIRAWKGSLFNEEVKFKVNDQQLTSSMLLDLWFNAHYFHSDETKEADLIRISTVIPDEMSKYLFVNAVYEATKAVFKLLESIHHLEPPKGRNVSYH